MSSCVQRQLWQIEFVSTTELNLPLLGVQVLQHRLIHLLECRCLFLSFLMTVAGLTCNTRAVSRIPTVPIALLAFRRRAMAHNIRALAVGAWSTCVIIVARYHTGGSVPLRHPSRMADQQICNTFQIFYGKKESPLAPQHSSDTVSCEKTKGFVRRYRGSPSWCERMCHHRDHFSHVFLSF